MIIYIVTNRINGKQYVGQTINSLKQRKGEHINASIKNKDKLYFHSAIRKHGPENFDWTTIHDDITTIDFLNRLEIFYIGFYDTFGNGYNLDIGGRNAIPSKETRKKLSKTLKKMWENKELRLAMSIARSGKNNPNYGKIYSLARRKRMSEVAKGEMVATIETQCIECGKIYIAKTRASLFCHNNCKAKYNRRVRKERYGMSDGKRYKSMYERGGDAE